MADLKVKPAPTIIDQWFSEIKMILNIHPGESQDQVFSGRYRNERTFLALTVADRSIRFMEHILRQERRNTPQASDASAKADVSPDHAQTASMKEHAALSVHDADIGGNSLGAMFTLCCAEIKGKGIECARGERETIIARTLIFLKDHNHLKGI